MTFLRCVGLFAIAAAPLAAQTPVAPVAPSPPRVRLQGDIGSEGEVYRMDGRDPRRPGESGRVYFNPTITLGSVTVSGNFLLSTEGSSLIGLGGLPGRQRINQFGLVPSWSWGKLYLGSFSDTWSPFTWGGVRVDGAGFDLSPGALRFGMFAGSSREAVFGGATSGSYSRSIAGARIGAGRRPDFGAPSRYIDIAVLRVRDDVSSLPPLSDSTPVPYLPDSLATEPDTALLPHVPINPYSVTPQENAVVATSAGASFLGGALTWTGELAGSLHSRDVRASPLTDDQVGDFPKLLRGLVTPRLGTHADVAWRSQFDLRVARLPGATATSPRTLSLTVGLQSIGAGYVSLGTPYLPNDLQGVDLRASLRFRHWSLHLDGLSQRDNLLGQKLATTDRARLGLVLSTQPVRGWHSTFRGSTIGMVREADDTLGAVDYSARLFGTTQTWAPARPGRVRSISASYTWQSTGDENPLRRSSALTSHTGDIRIAFPLGATASITPTLGLTSARVDTGGTAARATYGLAADWRDPGRRWAGSASVNRSQVGRTIAVGSRLSFRMDVTSADAVTLVLRTNRYRSLVDSARDFSERALNLRWGRRF
jgi:hypothetical protein